MGRKLHPYLGFGDVVISRQEWSSVVGNGRNNTVSRGIIIVAGAVIKAVTAIGTVSGTVSGAVLRAKIFIRVDF